MKKKKIILISAIVLIFAAVIFMLKNAVCEIITLLLISFVQAYIFLPVVKFLERKMKTSLAILTAFAVMGVINGIGIISVVPIFIKQIKGFCLSAPCYIGKMQDMFSSVCKKVPFAKSVVKQIGFQDKFSSFLTDKLSEISPLNLISFISVSLIIPITVYYFLRDREKIRKFSVFLIPSKIRQTVIYMCRDINRQMRDYIMGETAVMTAVSLLTGILLGLLGYEYWLLLGIFMGVFNIIPYIGPVLGTVPIVFIGASGGLTKIVLGIAVVIAVQQADNLILRPKIISSALKIHPLAVLICVAAGNSLGNIAGMILAVPVYIVLKIVFAEFYKIFSERKCKFQKKSEI